MVFQENHTLVSYLMCLTGVGPYPAVAGSRMTKLTIWYGRLLHIGLYIVIICLDTQYLIHNHFKMNISKYVLIVITVLLSNLLTAYNLRIQEKEAGLKKSYRVLNEVYDQLKTRKINVGKRYINYYITLYVILEMVVCGFYAEFISMCRQNGVLRYVAAIHFSQQYIQMLITIRFIYFIQNIHVALVMVNKNLKSIYNSHFQRTEVNFIPHTDVKRKSRVAIIGVRSKISIFSPDNAKEPTEYTIRKIALSYSKLCQLIYFINDKDGAGLLWMTVYMTINVIMSIYNQLLEIANVDKRDTAALVLPTMWLIITSTRLVLLTEQCHRIHEQMGNTRHHLSRLKSSFSLRDVAVSNELDLFQCLTVLRRPTFSPQYMFTLTRTFCTKVIGAVITMVVIMVTYGKEVKGTSEPVESASTTYNKTKYDR